MLTEAEATAFVTSVVNADGVGTLGSRNLPITLRAAGTARFAALILSGTSFDEAWAVKEKIEQLSRDFVAWDKERKAPTEEAPPAPKAAPVADPGEDDLFERPNAAPKKAAKKAAKKKAAAKRADADIS